MVAIKPADINAFLKSPPASIELVLIYGPDAGLVSERTRTLAHKLASLEDPAGEIITIDDSDLAADPDRLSVELHTIPMFGGRQVIRLKAGPRLGPKLIEGLLSNEPKQSRLIIEAGDLKKTAKLRQLFEKSASARCLPCYADDARSLNDLIRAEMAAANKQIAPEATQHLQTLLGADRSLSRAEIEKLILYTEGQAKITVADIDAIIGDSASLAIDAICYAVTGANAKDALSQFDRALSAGHAPQAITNALARHLMTLFHVRAALEAGNSLEGAMRKLRPPIFYKRQQEFQSQTRKWTANALTKALRLIQETLIRCRTSPNLERAYTERLLMAISRMGV